MADPDPLPQPAPFPIRIVADPSSNPDVPRIPSPDLPSSKPKSDYFYRAWDKFLSVEQKRAKATSRAARKLEQEKNTVEEHQPGGLRTEDNAAGSWEHAAADCRAKVEAIVEECRRLNQKYRDAIFDLEANPYCLQSLTGRMPKAVDDIDEPPWIKRVEDIFEDPQFYIDGATPTDVHQGNGGDCWFLASLMAVSAKKELIENLCVARDEKVGVYGFVFYRDGEWIYEVIDDKLYMRVGDDDNLRVVRDWSKDAKEGLSIKHDGEKLKDQLQRGGEALYFSHCKSSETWLPLIEKAYAKAHGDYASIEGGFASEGIEDLTGGVAVVINPEDIMDKERFWREQLSQVNGKYLFGGGSKAAGSKGFVGGHAYTVLEAWEEEDLRLLKLRNPWGEVEWEGDWSDGSKLWTPDMMRKLGHTFGDDGVFWISYKDFLKHFPSINRVRLFDRSWQVSQRWTCVNVPWTVDYLDAKFELTLTARGPVVIVLSQPDDRYFYGLRGRHLFSMHFRLYRRTSSGDAYLVRSMHNSGNETVFTRSVSAEHDDLAPGRYFVIFKVTAIRTAQPTAEEAVLKHAVDRKDKLLQVGRRFDFAQTKGNLRAAEKANRAARRAGHRAALTRLLKRNRRSNAEDRARARRRKSRVDDAMGAKRKAVEDKEREKRRRRTRREKARAARDKDSQTSPDLVEKPGAAPSLDDSSDARYGGVTPATEDSARSEAAVRDDTAGGASRTEESDGDASRPPVTEAGNGAAAELDSQFEKLSLDEKTDTAARGMVSAGTDDGAEKTSERGSEHDSDKIPGENLVDERRKATEVTPNDDRAVGQSEAAKEASKPRKSKVEEPEPTKGIFRRATKRTDDTRTIKDSDHQDDDDDDDDDDDEDEDDEDYDSPPEEIEELEDDDFEWDSDIDGPAMMSTTSVDSSSSAARELDVFHDDPWNAMCVLGLRVYSKGDVKIRVVVDGDEEDEEGEQDDDDDDDEKREHEEVDEGDGVREKEEARMGNVAKVKEEAQVKEEAKMNEEAKVKEEANAQEEAKENGETKRDEAVRKVEAKEEEVDLE